MSVDLVIRNMTRPEVDELVEWAALEGWNPGLRDAEIFWATDPEAFIAAELEGKLIGGGAIASYDGKFGFMGFFIVKPEFRGRGYGNRLWHARRDRLLERLDPGAAIGMDGVFDMQSYYAKGGFVFSHRNLRFRFDSAPAAPARDESGGECVALGEIPLAEVEAYDRQCFPAPRPTFLTRWIGQDDAQALGILRDEEVAGYGVIRRCREGCKIGPLFADDAAAAEALFAGLAPYVGKGPVFLDAPENNPAAMALVQRNGGVEVFGCARMYLGQVPAVAQQRVFGITTFEFG